MQCVCSLYFINSVVLNPKPTYEYYYKLGASKIDLHPILLCLFKSKVGGIQLVVYCSNRQCLLYPL